MGHSISSAAYRMTITSRPGPLLPEICSRRRSIIFAAAKAVRMRLMRPGLIPTSRATSARSMRTTPVDRSRLRRRAAQTRIVVTPPNPPPIPAIVSMARHNAATSTVSLPPAACFGEAVTIRCRPSGLSMASRPVAAPPLPVQLCHDVCHGRPFWKKKGPENRGFPGLVNREASRLGDEGSEDPFRPSRRMTRMIGATAACVIPDMHQSGMRLAHG